MNIPHVPDENVLAVGPVLTEIAVEHRYRAAQGALKVTLKARFTSVILAALEAYESRFVSVLHKILVLLPRQIESYKLDVRVLERKALNINFVRYSENRNLIIFKSPSLLINLTNSNDNRH